jgi:sporulation protein YlmC with PRC-barrel domain
MAISIEQITALRGSPVISSEGEEIGELHQVYYDEQTQQPRWVEVKRGLLHMRHAVVPLEGAEVHDVKLHVPFTRDQVDSAPEPELVHVLSPASEADLDRHFGVDSRHKAGHPDQTAFVQVIRLYVWPEP